MLLEIKKNTGGKPSVFFFISSPAQITISRAPLFSRGVIGALNARFSLQVDR